MTSFLKIAIAVVAFSAVTTSLADASAYDSGVYQSCEDHDYTPHGVWDCR
ncbi:MAG: hypothetical protein JSR99_19190 [Proteobacteria bacterium]|nr:hypothetical protein [Pseudomonadota bacterium]